MIGVELIDRGKRKNPMNADAIRQLFDYHFSENDKLLSGYASQLSWEQLNQKIHYSYGSIWDQLLHLMRVDEAWFSDLRGEELLDAGDSKYYSDLKKLRVQWDQVERGIREYLDDLSDDRLMDKPLQGEDHDLRLWQILFHVVNHGTDHRAQILRIMHDLGVQTQSQDFIFFVYENPS